MTTIFHCQFGSHVYGTNLPTSDHDFKKIYLPSAEDILLQRVVGSKNEGTKTNKNEKNGIDDIDVETFSLQKYLKLLLEGQTVALSMLFTPLKWHIGKCHPAWQDIHLKRQEFLHSGVSAFAGYCRQQANKYGIKGSRVSAVRKILDTIYLLIDSHGHLTKLSVVWKELEEVVNVTEHCSIIAADVNTRNNARMIDCCNRKVQEFITLKEAASIYQHVFDEYGHRALQAEKEENVDWKALMHATRVAAEAKELLLSAYITYPRPEAELLLKIRKGELHYKEVAEIIEQGLLDLEIASEKSILPKKPNYELADYIVMHWYKTRITDYK